MSLHLVKDIKFAHLYDGIFSYLNAVSTVTGLLLYNVTKDGMSLRYDSIVLLGNTPVIYVIKYDNGTNRTMESSDISVYIPSTPLNARYNVSVAYKTDSSVASPFSEVISSGNHFFSFCPSCNFKKSVDRKQLMKKYSGAKKYKGV